MNTELVVAELEHYFAIGIIIACFLIGFIVKNYTKIKNKYSPLIMICVGILISIIFCINDKTAINYSSVLAGAVSGLASCGVYDLISKSLGISKSKDSDEKSDNESNNNIVG